MKYYKFDNGIGNVKVYVRDGWCQFHSMCAQTRFFTLDSNKSQRFCVWDFVSYATPICRVWHDTTYNTWYVSVNCDCYRCSSSTIHQFSRWLRESPICRIGYHDIKYLETLEKSGTPNICTVSFTDNIQVSFCSNNKMREIIGW